MLSVAMYIYMYHQLKSRHIRPRSGNSPVYLMIRDSILRSW